MEHNVELLLPAGNLEIAKTAIDHGANAVYVGAEQFSARAKAKNFSLEDFNEIIQYAHKNKAKVFCAFNILLFNHEFESAIKLATNLAKNGLDAFIVQDLGIANILISFFPEIEVHASTQLAVMNLSGVKALKLIGFDRVVLAREISLDSLKHIRKNTSIPLEVFIQGALCVSYSGLCYMSTFQGDRSSNRGSCAQPCRREYILIKKENNCILTIAEGYLLSPKDLNLINDIPTLIDLKIDSLKIEGRMKQFEYVALMADTYRDRIDQYIDKNDSLFDIRSSYYKMASVFNREGFTTGFFHGYEGLKMMSYSSPRNTGVDIGEILQIDNKYCKVRLTDSLYLGDGIVIYNENFQSLWGGYLDNLYNSNLDSVNNVQCGEIAIIEHKIDKVKDFNQSFRFYRTFNKELSKKILKTKKNKIRDIEKKGELSFYVNISVGSSLEIIAILNKNDFVLNYKWHSDLIVEKSNNNISCEDIIKKGLSKVTAQGYALSRVEIIEKVPAFIPMSIITKAKNDIIEFFDSKIQIENNKVRIPAFDINDRLEKIHSFLDEIPPQIHIKHKPRISVQVHTIEQAQAAIEGGADEINILLLATHSGEKIDFEKLKKLSNFVNIIFSLPPLIKDDLEEKYYQKLCKKIVENGYSNFMISNIGQAYLLDAIGIDYYYSDHSLNLTNDITASLLMKIGFARQTFSLELDYDQIKEMSSIGNIPLELIVYGALPIMNTRYCPIGSIVGKRSVQQVCSQPCKKAKYFLKREDKEYEIKNDFFCNTYILNDKTYDLLPHMEKILNLGIDYLRIAGAFMNSNDIKNTTKNLKHIINEYFETKKLLSYKKQNNTTDGHFLRGVR